MKKVILSIVLALAALSFTQDAFAYSCNTYCNGNYCSTNCY